MSTQVSGSSCTLSGPGSTRPTSLGGSLLAWSEPLQGGAGSQPLGWVLALVHILPIARAHFRWSRMVSWASVPSDAQAWVGQDGLEALPAGMVLGPRLSLPCVFSRALTVSGMPA